MLAEERVGFQDKERILPVFDPTGEENKPEPIGLRKGRLFDLTVKDDELLTKQSIFSNEVGFAACQVGGRAEHNRMVGGLAKMQKGLFKQREQTDKWLDEQMQDGRHEG